MVNAVSITRLLHITTTTTKEGEKNKKKEKQKEDPGKRCKLERSSLRC